MQNSFTLKDPKIALGKPSKKQNSKSELFKLFDVRSRRKHDLSYILIVVLTGIIQLSSAICTF